MKSIIGRENFMKLTIRKKIVIGFAIVIVMSLLIGFVAIFSINKTNYEWQHAEHNGFQPTINFHEATIELTHAQLSIANFLINYPEMGAQAAEEKYITAFHKHYDTTITILQEIANHELESKELKDQTREVISLLENYDNKALKIIDLVKNRGVKNEGSIGKMRTAIHELEQSLKKQSMDNLELLILQARRTEKDFLLKTDDKYIEQNTVALNELREEIDKSSLSETIKIELFKNINTYQQTFHEITEIIKNIYKQENDLELFLVEIENQMEEVEEASHENQKKYMDDAMAIAKPATVIMIVIVLISIILASIIGSIISKNINIPLKKLIQSMQKGATGDLRSRVHLQTNDEMKDLGDEFNTFMEKLNAFIKRIHDVTYQLTAASKELLRTSEEQSTGVSEQAASVTETSAAAEEMSKSAMQIGDNIKIILDAAIHALEGMMKIKDSIEDTNGSISSLDEKSRQIGSIIELIDDVADQTNLLAVNAAIEAARAGEQGRGFTVVADEIRKLSDSTAKSTGEITALIEVIQHQMGNAIIAMDQSIHNVDIELHASEETAGKAKEITMAVNQQTNGANQIAAAMGNIDATMKQISQGSQQSQVAANQLTAIAGELKDSTDQFKITE